MAAVGGITILLEADLGVYGEGLAEAGVGFGAGGLVLPAKGFAAARWARSFGVA